MATLLEMYENYYNGNKKEFCEQVTAYGAGDFARDIQNDEDSDGNPVISYEHCYDMLRCYIITTA